MVGKMVIVKLMVYFVMKFVVFGFFNVLWLELKLFGVVVMIVNLGLIEIDFFDKVDLSGSYLEKVG